MLLPILLHAVVSNAYAFLEPSPTTRAWRGIHGAASTTPAPQVLREHDLRKRLDNGENTCGYLNGEPRTCVSTLAYCVGTILPDLDAYQYCSLPGDQVNLIYTTAIASAVDGSPCASSTLCCSSLYPDVQTYLYTASGYTVTGFGCDSFAGIFTYEPAGNLLYPPSYSAALARITASSSSPLSFSVPAPIPGDTTAISSKPFGPTATSAPAPTQSSSSSSSSSSSASPSPTSSNGSGLSLGAEVGIGVGAGVGCLIALAGGIFICLRRRRRNKPYPTSNAAAPPGMVDGSQMYYQGPGHQPWQTNSGQGYQNPANQSWQNNAVQGHQNPGSQKWQTSPGQGHQSPTNQPWQTHSVQGHDYDNRASELPSYSKTAHAYSPAEMPTP